MEEEALDFCSVEYGSTITDCWRSDIYICIYIYIIFPRVGVISQEKFKLVGDVSCNTEGR